MSPKDQSLRVVESGNGNNGSGNGNGNGNSNNKSSAIPDGFHF